MGEWMTQGDLDGIFARLDSGGELQGWGLSRHRDYDMLFNAEKRMWRRLRNGATWREVSDEDDDDRRR